MSKNQVSTTEVRNTQVLVDIPCIRAETFERLLDIMRSERFATFDEALKQLLEDWETYASARNEWNSPSNQLGMYLSDPESLADPEAREEFEALKKLHPEELRNRLAYLRWSNKMNPTIDSDYVRVLKNKEQFGADVCSVVEELEATD